MLIEGRHKNNVMRFMNWAEARIWQRAHKGSVLVEIQEQHAQNTKIAVAQENLLRMNPGRPDREGWSKLEDNMGDQHFGLAPEDQLGPEADQLSATPNGLIVKPVLARREITGVRGSDPDSDKTYRRAARFRKHPDGSVACCVMCNKYIRIEIDAINEYDQQADEHTWYCLDCAGDDILARAGVRQAQLFHKPPSSQWGNYFHDRNELAAAMKGFLETAISRGITDTRNLLDFFPILMAALVADEGAAYTHPRCTPQPELVEPRYEFKG